VPASLLRYSDEQTVAGVAAVFTAIESSAADPGSFEAWGVVAAPRYLGRESLAQTLRSFDAEGVWGVSPHLIPHFALHAVSGTISQGLGLHGPNLGVGGGLYATAEGVLAALTWLTTGVAPGVWLVLSGWSPELVPDGRGDAPVEGECQALALALVAARNGDIRTVLRVAVGAEPHRPPAPTDLVRLAGCLARREERARQVVASDPRGRLQVALVTSADGSG
jgi:hypothetical protein